MAKGFRGKTVLKKAGKKGVKTHGAMKPSHSTSYHGAMKKGGKSRGY